MLGGVEPVAEAAKAPHVAPAGKRGKADKKVASAVMSKAEMRERLLAAIAELEGCRGILLGESAPASARRATSKTAAPAQRRAARA